MNTLELVLLDHARVHAPAVSQPGASSDDPLVHGLSDARLRLRPKGLNPLTWVLWHTARTEDIGANLMIDGHGQLFDEDHWAERIGAPYRHNGAGMDDAEVDALNETVNLDSLRSYRIAVGRRTREVLRELRPEELRETPDPSCLERVLTVGAVHRRFDRSIVERMWGDKTKAWFLYFVTGHNYQHLGEAHCIRGQIERGFIDG